MSGLEQFQAAAHAWLNDELDDSSYADRLRTMLGRGYVPVPVVAEVGIAPVLVRFDRVYGLIKCYPANQQAEVLAKIAGTKTLTSQALAGARALGLVVEEVGGSHLADFLGTRETRCSDCLDRAGFDGLGRTCKKCGGSGVLVVPA